MYEDFYTVDKTATFSENGSKSIHCAVCDIPNEETVEIIPAAKTPTLSKSSYIYDGNVKNPTVTVKDSEGNTISSYSVKCTTDGKSVGKHSVTVTLNGDYYSGETKLSFTISPVSTSITSLTAGGRNFTVKWNAVTSQVSGYQIYYATKSDFSNTKKVYATGSNTVSNTFASLTAGTKYYVKVRTYKTVDGTKYYSSWSDVKTVTPNPLSTSITSLAASGNNFTVKWNAVTSQVSGYQVYYATKSDFSNTKKMFVTNASTVSKTFSSLTAGTKYYVKVRTYKTVDGTKHYSSWSDVKSVVLKPVATSITSLVAGGRNFTVKWNKATGNATGYQIYYATKSDFSNTKKMYVTSASTISKTFSSLTAGSKYYVKVRTYKTIDGTKYYSSWSDVKTVTPNPVSTSITSLTAGVKSFTVKWSEVTSNATGYQIYYATKSDFSNAKKMYVTNASTVSKTFKSLTTGTTYYVKVRTYKTVGETKYYSGWSLVKTTTIK